MLLSSELCKRPCLYYQQRDWVGGVRKVAIFADVQYYLYWQRVGGRVRKSPKMCWLTIGMVPNEGSWFLTAPVFTIYWQSKLLRKKGQKTSIVGSLLKKNATLFRLIIFLRIGIWNLRTIASVEIFVRLCNDQVLLSTLFSFAVKKK
jgi:hypothetical protein